MIVTNIIVLTITFGILGAFISVVAISQTALRHLEDQAKVAVFFKDDFLEQSILELKTKYEANPKVADVIYVSKEQALKIFTETHKDQPALLRSATADILPASLHIKAKKLADLSVLAQELSSLDGVENIKYYKDAIENFRRWSNTIYLVGFVFVGLFFIVSYSVVIATLRMIITSKGTELEILKLVGATDSYVKSPFLFQGVFLGGVASFLAALILIITSLLLEVTRAYTGNISLAFVPGFRLNHVLFTAILGAILVASGLFLGYFGSLSAVKKYLRY